MTSISPIPGRSLQAGFLKTALLVVLVGLIFGGSLAVLWVSQTPAGTSAASSLSILFALGSMQSWWYVTRAAGLTSYFLMWLSMVWGLGVASRVFHPAIEGTQTYDFHEFLSLFGLGFIILHLGVLMLDRYKPFSLWEVLVPFIAAYRPLWVGLGIIGFYIFLLVTVTFYLRRVIGTQTFRSIHVLSLLGYLGTTLHGLFSGTDSALPVTKLLYVGTFLVVVFLTVYWLVLSGLSRREKVSSGTRVLATSANLSNEP